MSEHLEPQYDYRPGLLLETEQHRPGLAAKKSVSFVRPTELRLPDDRQTLAKQVDTLLETPHVERDAQTGASLEFVIINNEAEDGELEVLHLQWHTAVSDPGVRPLLLALALGGKRRMVVSAAGMGQATPLPTSVAKQVSQTGSFIPYQEHHASLYERVLADYESTSFGGESEGARRALALAAIWEHVRAVTVIDPPGSRDALGAYGIGMAFYRERKHAVRYVEQATDPELVEAQRRQDGLERVAASLKQHRQNRNFGNVLVHEPRGMAREGLAADAQTALPHVQERFSFVAPEFSELNRPEDILRIARQLAASRDDNLYRPIISVMKFPGTHSFGAANMPVTARLYDAADQLAQDLA